jgi:Mn-dependent DtxR family transcriptional regulator
MTGRPEAVDPTLAALADRGLVEARGTAWALTPAGLAEARRLGGGHVLTGQAL